jgi:hypothetical protein
MLGAHRIGLAPLRLLASAIAIGACVGSIGDGAGGSGEGIGPAGSGVGSQPGKTTQSACATLTPGPTPLRRLTQSEYDNTVRDLLGDTTSPASQFPPDQRVGDFTNTAVALTVSPLLAQNYEAAAEALAATAVTHLGQVASACDTVATGEDACAKQFIDAFGKRAFRRKLTTDESAGLFGLYQMNRAGADYKNGVQSVIEAVLQSSAFLYRPEFGASDRAQGTVLPLTSYEMASRLSYFLWSSMPDDTLFAAADADALQTADQISAQASRMLADPKAHPAVGEFFDEWLGVDRIEAAAKDPTTYTAYTSDVRDSMQAETAAFADWVMWQSDGKLSTLLTSPVTFLDANLAPLYGVSGITATTPQKVSLDPSQRAGILTQAAVLTVLAKPDRSSPVLRGKFIREKLLCQPVSPPPQNIVITPPMIQAGVSTRDMFTMHSQVQPCKGCHTLMDPIGFGFENYDGIGRWRTTDLGQTVNSTGTLQGSDVDGTFNGAVDLAHKLAGSSEVRDCMATEWFHYAMGRGDTPEDTCSLGTLKQAFADSQTDMRKLLVAVTQTPAFRYRNEVTP